MPKKAAAATATPAMPSSNFFLQDIFSLVLADSLSLAPLLPVDAGITGSTPTAPWLLIEFGSSDVVGCESLSGAAPYGGSCITLGLGTGAGAPAAVSSESIIPGITSRPESSLSTSALSSWLALSALLSAELDCSAALSLAETLLPGSGGSSPSSALSSAELSTGSTSAATGSLAS